MPLRRGINGSSAAVSSPQQQHWMGLLTTLDGNYDVYGHVTATNVKLLALCQTPCKDGPVKALLNNIHIHYITYIMNPFHKLQGPIYSRSFDKNVKYAVRQYENISAPLEI
jgi:Sedlin, N-terminal conserved region